MKYIFRNKFTFYVICGVVYCHMQQAIEIDNFIAATSRSSQVQEKHPEIDQR